MTKENVRIIPLVDIIRPFSIGNFLHKRSSICHELLSEAAELLDSLGWNGSFALYRNPSDTDTIRLYLKIAYVGACFVEGPWDRIKEQLPTIVPMVLVVRELRKQPNIGMLWIESNLKEMDYVEAGSLQKPASQEIYEMINDIGYHSQPFATVDINDAERIIKGKKQVAGFRADSTYDNYKTTLTGLSEKTAEEDLTLSDLLVYIDTAEEDKMAEHPERISAIFEHLGLSDMDNDIRVIAGAGTNPYIKSGCFRLTVIAGYK